MINAIIEGIFNLITKLFDLLFSPIISVLFTLFPDLSTVYNFVYDFLSSACTHVALVLDLLLVPKQAIVFLFDYFLILYTIFVTVRVIRFSINIYQKFKI